MKLKVDVDVCQGHGRCVAVAPGLFEFLEGEEQPSVIKPEIFNADDISKAKRAFRACPERAVVIED